MYNYNMYNPMPNIVPPQYSTIYGKVVDNIDTVKASDVPMNTFSVFPRGDFGEVYIKTWNTDGTTKIITFKPSESSKDQYLEILKNIQKSIDRLSPIQKKKEGE